MCDTFVLIYAAASAALRNGVCFQSTLVTRLTVHDVTHGQLGVSLFALLSLSLCSSKTDVCLLLTSADQLLSSARHKVLSRATLDTLLSGPKAKKRSTAASQQATCLACTISFVVLAVTTTLFLSATTKSWHPRPLLCCNSLGPTDLRRF